MHRLAGRLQREIKLAEQQEEHERCSRRSFLLLGERRGKRLKWWPV
jgi:hypothetical protein